MYVFIHVTSSVLFRTCFFLIHVVVILIPPIVKMDIWIKYQLHMYLGFRFFSIQDCEHCLLGHGCTCIDLSVTDAQKLGGPVMCWY